MVSFPRTGHHHRRSFQGLDRGSDRRSFQPREKTEIKTKAQSIIDLMDSMGINIEKAMELLKIKSDDKDVYRQSVGNMLALK